MTKKLPIDRTVTDSLAFAWAHWGAAVRLGWFPMLLAAATMLGGLLLFASDVPELRFVMEAMAAGQPLPEAVFALEAAGEAGTLPAGDPALMARNSLIVTALCFAASLLFLPFYTAFTRAAAGAAPLPRGVVYLRFGAPEGRVILAALIQIAVVFVVTAVAATLLGLLAALVAGTPLGAASDFLGAVMVASGGEMPVIVAAALPLVLLALQVWLTLRLFVLVPAAATEARFNPLAAFLATGGNVFRLLGAMVLFALVIAALVLAAGLLTMVLGILLGVIGAQFGTQTLAGILFGTFSAGVFILIQLFTFLVVAVMGIAFPAKAWAALRPDGD